MEILCVGLMVCDILVKPVTRDALERDTNVVDFIQMRSGGDALNAAVNLSKLGVQAGIIGKVGQDGFGRFLLETAAGCGLDTRGVVTTAECGTSTSVVMIHPDGERSFLFSPGATFTLREDEVDLGMAAGARILEVGSACALPGLDGAGLAALLRRARAAGMLTALDVTNPGPAALEALSPALASLDLFLPSENEARDLTGLDDPRAMARAFLARGVGVAGIKLGRRGCWIASAEGEWHIPAFDAPVVDTTGAGDAFVAGFLAATLRGLPLPERGRMANAAGALCVGQVGATTGMRPWDELVQFAGQAGMIAEEV